MAAKTSWLRYGTKLRPVTLCIVGDNDILDRCARDLPLPRQATREAAWLPRLAACQKSFFLRR